MMRYDAIAKVAPLCLMHDRRTQNSSYCKLCWLQQDLVYTNVRGGLKVKLASPNERE
jgi:hypothetical protein